MLDIMKQNFIIHSKYSKFWLYASASVLIVIGLWKVRRSHSHKFKNGVKINATMRGIITVGYGGIKDIQIVNDLVKPTIKYEDEVLIQVKAASIDHLDLNITQGHGRVLRQHLNRFTKHAKHEFPIVLGRDAAGIVVEIGKEVDSLDVGDEVWLFSEYWQPGLLAEYVVVKENQVNKKPKNLTYELAASLPYVGLLTLNVLLNQGKLGPDSTRNKRVLIHAGNTAQGILAIQLVKAWGGHVTTTVPTVGLPLVRMYGADDVIVYSVTDFKTELEKRQKFDVILNTTGCFLHEACLDICSPNGRVVSIIKSPFTFDSYGIFMGGIISSWMKLKFIILEFLGKSCCNYVNFDRESFKLLAEMVENEKIEAVVERIYDIEDTNEAFKYLLEEITVGRIIIGIPNKL